MTDYLDDETRIAAHERVAEAIKGFESAVAVAEQTQRKGAGRKVKARGVEVVRAATMELLSSVEEVLTVMADMAGEIEALRRGNSPVAGQSAGERSTRH